MENPQQPFADEPLETSLGLGTCASPIHGVPAAAHLVSQLALKSHAQADVALRLKVHETQVVPEAQGRAEDAGYGKSTSRA